MFYIVFFVDLKKNIVVPKQWIKDIKLHKEKFYNNSLNTNQTYTCFYTQNPAAFEDSLPNGKFAPNFDLQKNLDDDGLFKVKLKSYRSKYLCYCLLFSE